MRKITKLGIAAGIIGLGSLLISFIGGPSHAADIDDSPDCDNVAIFYCGTMSESEFHHKWNNDGRYGDHEKVYNSFGIHKEDVRDTVNGVVWRDGRVTLDDGTVVATNATTAGRNYGGSSIHGTQNAAKFSASKFVNEGQTAMIKMEHGEFKFAVIKSCGNPVSANPTPQPKPEPKPEPKPQPKPKPKKIEVCDVEKQKTITIKESNFNSEKHSYDMEDCEPKHIEVCDTKKHKVVTINERELNIKRHSHDMDDCKPKAKDIKVCDTHNRQTITIKEDQLDNSRHSTDLSDCKTKYIKVCDIDELKITKIDEMNYDSSIHSKDMSDCEKLEPIAMCEALSNPKITDRTKVDLTASAHAENEATIQGYVFVITDSDGEVVTTRQVSTSEPTATTQVDISKAGTYTVKVTVRTSEGDKTSSDCEKQFTIDKPVAGKITVCVVDQRSIIEISEDEFNSTIHSKDLSKCDEPEPAAPEAPAPTKEAPVELPKTGAMDGILTALGIGTLATSSIAYAISRRHSLVG